MSGRPGGCEHGPMDAGPPRHAAEEPVPLVGDAVCDAGGVDCEVVDHDGLAPGKVVLHCVGGGHRLQDGPRRVRDDVLHGGHPEPVLVREHLLIYQHHQSGCLWHETGMSVWIRTAVTVAFCLSTSGRLNPFF